MNESPDHIETGKWTASRREIARVPAGQDALLVPTPGAGTRLLQGVPDASARAAVAAAARASWADSLYPNEPRIEPRVRIARFTTLLKRGKVAGAVATLTVWAAVSAYLLLSTPGYESTAVMLVDTRRLAETSARYGSEADALGAFGGAKLANQAEVLRLAPVIADTTAARLLASLGEAEKAGLPAPRDGSSRAAFVALWLKKSAVTVEPKAEDEADIIEIRSSAASPELAARIADTYATSYVDLIRTGVQEQRARALAFQQDRVTEYEGEVAGIDERLREFFQDNGTLTITTEAEIATRHVSDLRSVLDEAQIAYSTHTATLASLEAELGALNPELLSARIASSADAEIRASQALIAELELSVAQYYSRTPSLRDDPSPSPPLVNDLARLAAERTRLEELSRRLVTDVMSTSGIDLSQETGGRSYLLQLRQRIAEARVAVAAAEAKRDAVRRRLGAFEQSKRRYSEQAIPLAQLQREKTLAEARYKTASEALTALQLDDPGEYVRLIARAEVSTEPAGPAPPFVILFGLFVGFLVGGGVAYGRARLDNRVFGTEELDPEGVPTDAVLPDVSDLVRKAFRGEEYVQVAGRPVSSRVVTVSSAHSPEAALFRKLSTRLAATTPRGSVILFTSAEAGAGKSVTAANTAAALALAGFRTLLVDADTYRMAQRRLMGFSEASCFDVEAGSFFEGGGLESRNGALRLLYGITLYSTRPVATEHLAVHQLDRLVRFYREHFDFIVVDSPPVMATAFTLAAGVLADRRLMVVSSGSTPLDLLRQAKSEMASAGSPVTGFVLTRFDTSSSSTYRSTYHEIRGYHGAAGVT